MATYNGEKYLSEQIDSILAQMTCNDELIIVDDCSTDNTVNILHELDDTRIKIHFNKSNRGVNYSFGLALSLANNEVIFMSDQDDIWIEGRMKSMADELIKSGASVITSNAEFINQKGEKILFNIDGVKKKNSKYYFKNILNIFLGKTNYYGCTMALRKSFCAIILPVPSYVESHDLWIALAGNVYRSNLHMDDFTLLRRIHNANASIIKRRLLPKMWSRIIFLRSIIEIYSRILKVK
jgi:glycosyltransferase involved in cell wall biosynthesis